MTFPLWDAIAPIPTNSQSAINVADYNIVLVAFSGGKDSLACLLHLLELGVKPEKIELHHHDVDGHGRNFIDWPITPAYCKAVADHFDIRMLFSFKEGGFEREMLRHNARTAPIRWQHLNGAVSELTPASNCGATAADRTDVRRLREPRGR